MVLNDAILTTAAIAAVVIILLSAIALFKPSFVFFPPPSKRSWQYWLFWSLFRLMFIGVVILSFTSYNTTPIISEPIRFFICLPLLIVGFGLATHLSIQLGLANAHGEAKGLVISGWYRWSRNPIYVCSLLGMLGWCLFIGSSYVSVLLALWAVMYIVAPLLEERWLEKTYGQAFLSYKARVPRFLGFPK